MARGKASGGTRQQWADHVAKLEALHPTVHVPAPRVTAKNATPVTVAPVNLAGMIGRHGERTTIRDGIKFRSILEADRYSELKLLRLAGTVAWFLRQVPFDVTLGVVYRADFVVVWNRIGTSGEVVTVEETKGHLTDVARIKIAAVEERYSIKITVLRRRDVSRHG